MPLLMQRLAIGRVVIVAILIVIVVAAAGSAYYLYYRPPSIQNIRVGSTAGTPDPSDVPQWHAWLVDAKTLGLNVTLTVFTGQQAAVSALLSGEIDVLDSSPAALIDLVNEGYPIIAFGVSVDAPDGLMVATSNITSMGQLATEHVTVGMTSLTDSSYYFAAVWLSEHGYNVSDVNWVIVPGAAGRTAALLSGKIQAGVVDVAGWLQINSTAPGKFHVLMSLAQMVPGFPQELLFTTKSYFNSHKAELIKVMEAMLMGHRWAQNKAAYMAYAPSVVGSPLTTQQLSESYDELKALGLWDPNCTWNPSIADLITSVLAEYHVSGVTKAPPTSAWTDFTVYQSALRALGPYTATTNTV